MADLPGSSFRLLVRFEVSNCGTAGPLVPGCLARCRDDALGLRAVGQVLRGAGGAAVGDDVDEDRFQAVGTVGIGLAIRDRLSDRK